MARRAPAGYVTVAEAEEITGFSGPTIREAAQSGALKGFQRVRKSPWFFKTNDLLAWRGMDEQQAS